VDPQTPRELGDIEDAEPERREPSRTVPLKKNLDDFLAEFEERLRDSPGEPATSAQAALEGRAQGTWRTPIEAGERGGRRLSPRRATPRPDTERRRDAPAPPVPAPGPEPVTVAGVTEVAPDEPALNPTDAAEPLTTLEPPADRDAEATPGAESAEVAAAEGDVATTGRKRHRRHRRPRRR
jgi:hypothetical protein